MADGQKKEVFCNIGTPEEAAAIADVVTAVQQEERENLKPITMSGEISDPPRSRKAIKAEVNAEAQAVADRWLKNAEGCIEPSKEDVFNSARMYLGLKHCVEEEQADAVSVDCIMMFYTTDLSVYPCMSHSQMCDDGLTGTCESDIDSTLTQLAIRYLTGRAGFISDPVIDTATNQIIYAHCSAATKWFGPDSAPSPYFLRSHSEDHNSTSIQTIMPVGETVTTVKMDIETHSMALHTAKAVGNVTEEKGCRTKLAGEVPDAQVLLDNWDTDVFSWHKVTFYGDYRKDFLNLAKLYSMKTIQEDRLNPGC